MVFEDGTVSTECDRCREMWRERNERGVVGDPPCEDCEFDPSQDFKLMDENVFAAKIYQQVKDQVILYFNGEASIEYDIDHLAIWAMIDHFPRKISKPFEVFDLVLRTYHHFLSERNLSRAGS